MIKNKFEECEIIRTYYFATETEQNTGFLQQINLLPYCQVIKGRLQKKTIKIKPEHKISCSRCHEFVNGEIKTLVDKGTDVNLAVEMLKHAYINSYDIAILASRDGDFSSVVQIIKNLGKNTELVLFEDSKNDARDLTNCVDNVTMIYKNEYNLLKREHETVHETENFDFKNEVKNETEVAETTFY